MNDQPTSSKWGANRAKIELTRAERQALIAELRDQLGADHVIVQAIHGESTAMTLSTDRLDFAVALAAVAASLTCVLRTVPRQKRVPLVIKLTDKLIRDVIQTP